MGYLTYMYGKRSPDFVKGFLAAMDAYSIWKDGKRYIGAGHELKFAMDSDVEELAEIPEDFEEFITFYTGG